MGSWADDAWRWIYSPPPFPSIPSAVAGQFLGLGKTIEQSCLFFYADGFKDGCVCAAVAMIAGWFAVSFVKSNWE